MSLMQVQFSTIKEKEAFRREDNEEATFHTKLTRRTVQVLKRGGVLGEWEVDYYISNMKGVPVYVEEGYTLNRVPFNMRDGAVTYKLQAVDREQR